MNEICFSIALSCAVLALAGGCTLIAPSHHRVEDYSPIFASADACDTAQVEQAVSAEPSLLKATEWGHATLLHDVVEHNCVDLTRYLLDRGANPNATEDDGVTPLHLAAQLGNIKTVELLVAHGALINPVDSKGLTPFDRATLWGHPDVAAYLTQHGGVTRSS